MEGPVELESQLDLPERRWQEPFYYDIFHCFLLIIFTIHFWPQPYIQVIFTVQIVYKMNVLSLPEVA